jgi:hypothetical protein
MAPLGAYTPGAVAFAAGAGAGRALAAPLRKADSAGSVEIDVVERFLEPVDL